jgi:serine/threonine-protein kinase
MDTDRNLLFGVLALQLDLLDRDRFAEACAAWATRKGTPLADLLVERGWLTPRDRDDVERLLQRKLHKHGDAHASLAAVAGPEVRRALDTVDDADVEQSLASLPPAVEHASDLPTVDTRPPVGRYRVLRPHAKGGLGEVFVAHDEELNREVALKEIQQRHAHSPESRARFLLEAEITGGLEHPGVVPVYGLGAYADGRPFYAMRFIRGDNLKEAIARFHEADAPGRDPGGRALALRKLLGRFVDVCNAVAYAHSRGVLHRDLKPGNVMLGKYGETLIVDWGLAKPVDRPEPAAVEEPTLHPRSGSGLEPTRAGAAVGTPAYMSPEQAAGRLDLLGPASDIYSLGATLYTLLTGQAPVRESDLGEALRQVQRGDIVPPRRRKPRTPAALEAICLKAMAVRPEDRYATALDLAADVEHWLADEPVAAHPDALPARLGRWARRHRPLMAAAATLLLAAVAALAATAALVRRQQQETEHQKELAVAERDRADRNFALIQKALEETTTKIADNRRLREADFHDLRKELLAAAVPFYQDLANQAGGDAKLEAARGWTYLRLGKLRSEMFRVEEATADLHQAEAIFRRLRTDAPDTLDDRQGLAEALQALGSLLWDHAQLQPAEVALREAVRLGEELTAAAPAAPEHRKDLARSYELLGNVFTSLGRPQEALTEFRSALAIQARLVDEYPASADYRYGLASIHHNLGVFFYNAGQWRSSEEAYRTALRLFQELGAKFPAEYGYRKHLGREYLSLGILLDRIGKRQAAQEAFHEALGIQEKLVLEFPTLPSPRSDLARTCNNLSLIVADPARKEALAARALELKEKLVADFPRMPEYRDDLARSLLNQADATAQRGNWEEAEAIQRRAREIQAKLVADDPNEVQYAVYQGIGFLRTGNLEETRGRLEVALSWFDQAAAALERILARESSQVLPRHQFYRAHLHRAAILHALKRQPESLQAVDLLLTGRDVPTRVLCEGAATCALALEAKGNAPFAGQYADRALRLLARAKAEGHFRSPANVTWLKEEKDLQPLRQRDDFRAFLAELEKKP